MTTAIKYEDWEAKGRELFGSNRHDWRFVCPACGNELSLNEAKQKYPELAGCGWRPGEECIGRYTDRIDCDWCAYGLFRGPLSVADEKRTYYAFDFVGKPFTRRLDENDCRGRNQKAAQKEP